MVDKGGLVVRLRIRLSYRLRLRVWVSLAKGGLAVGLALLVQTP